MGERCEFIPEDYAVCELPEDSLLDPCEECAFDCVSQDVDFMPCLDLAVLRGVLPEKYYKDPAARSRLYRIYLKSSHDAASAAPATPPKAKGPIVEVVALADAGVNGCKCCWRTKDESVYNSMSCNCLEQAKKAGMDVRRNDIRSRVYLRKV